MQKKRGLVYLGILVILAVAVTVGIINRDWIYDFWRGMSYQPAAEMEKIKGKLSLTDRGEFLFKASRPELNEREVFNEVCREVLDKELAVLGCYAAGDIHIYNIQSKELDGILELTTAHELLHAVWARMNEGEKAALAGDLEKVYLENQKQLEKELESYDDKQRQEELYVRSGTEIKNLPESLEKHYAEIFKNQDMVVDYYNKYIAVFLAIEEEMEELKKEMDELRLRIDDLRNEYERRVINLNSEIENFNSCAVEPGCFTDENAFNTKRSELISEQGTLEEMYAQINTLIEQCNDLVERYNADVTRTEKLNRMMNSSMEVEEAE